MKYVYKSTERENKDVPTQSSINLNYRMLQREVCAWSNMVKISKCFSGMKSDQWLSTVFLLNPALSWLEEGKHAPMFWCPADTPGFNAIINAVLCNICLNVFMFVWMSISYVFSIIYMERKKQNSPPPNLRNLFLSFWFILMQGAALLLYLKWLIKNLWEMGFNVKLQIVY